MLQDMQDKSTQDTYIKQNRYAIVLFVALLLLLGLSLFAYASMSYYFNVAGTRIDDVHGSMDEYYVLAYPGMMQREELIQDQDILSEDEKNTDSSKQKKKKDASSVCTGMISQEAYETYHGDEHLALDTFLNEKIASYEKKGARVMSFEPLDISAYRYGTTIAQDGVIYGFLYIDEVVLEETGMRARIDEERTQFLEAQTDALDADAEVTNDTEGSQDIEQDVDTPEDEYDIAYELTPGFESYLDHVRAYFKAFHTDVVVIFTEEPALLEKHPYGDIVIPTVCSSYPKKGTRIKDTLFVPMPYYDEVGIVTVAPGKVISAKISKQKSKQSETSL